MEIGEINSMLLEELLGISNKRLKYIFEGKNLEEDSSSTEDDKSPDVISLDDISDDDFVIEINSDEEPKTKKSQKHTFKREPRSKKIKKERSEKVVSKPKQNEPIGEENLMSVLELLELQARARAIRSQLALEANRKEQDEEKKTQTDFEKNDDEEDAVIVEVPKEEIVITSSESENEDRIEKPDEDLQNKVEGNSNTIGDKNEQNEPNFGDIPIPSTANEAEDKNVVDGASSKSDKSEKHITSLEGSENSGKIKSTRGNVQNQDDHKLNTENSKEIKLRRFKSKLESFKKDILDEDKSVKIIDSIVIKPLDSSGQKSRDDNDGLVINVDQDDIDCIISD
ncbi:putative sodium-coupled neutral amino acid transporter 10 isoform X2 [Cylas formicarius]|nr:putative sodium-coupled neutral amino acid transporter 10 isoform X2 [Cylas formicarius]